MISIRSSLMSHQQQQLNTTALPSRQLDTALQTTPRERALPTTASMHLRLHHKLLGDTLQITGNPLCLCWCRRDAKALDIHAKLVEQGFGLVFVEVQVASLMCGRGELEGACICIRR